MANAIKNFHIFLRLPREDKKDQVASNFRNFFTFMIMIDNYIYARVIIWYIFLAAIAMTMIVVNYIVSDADSIMQVLSLFLFSSSMWLASILDPWTLPLWGCFQSLLIMIILYYFIDHCDWHRCSQGVTLGVFSIMYLILVILMTRSFLNEVGLALSVINIISVIIIFIIIIITVILIIIVTVITVVIVTVIVTVITIVIVNIIISVIVIVIVTVLVIVIKIVTMTVIRCTWSSSPMLSSHPSLA